ncbi:hypothetical protein TSTA_053860 [Talaromyces stipitatus ATCC 10500]|uniref:Zn(2)-C6 fungal-type domain-containing protein n=1 Tax=Talaromyces stipitatus (strain ATCC 10500 / CBS 375.48 / QM 6759 / NRRL 1006) TaxID=441959 RepID=B8MPY3_TALSN|nr:uncharacterized protein TSTA_053860 [Talaromyces stipitatus ATCC 10500]EED12873.1 hypothetical protein TSTA_053860 [Talaromyces stipitatus ATCC 10500]
MNKSCGPCAASKLRCDLARESSSCSRCLRKGLVCQRIERKKRKGNSSTNNSASGTPNSPDHEGPSFIEDHALTGLTADDDNHFLSQLADIGSLIDMSAWAWESEASSAISQQFNSLSQGIFLSKQASSDATSVPIHRLEKYARLYFSHFHQFFPILHVPTFCLQSSCPALVRAICFIGSGFDHQLETASDANLLFDSLPIILARSCVQSGGVKLSFDELQAWLLILFASMTNGGDPERAASRLLHPLLVTAVRQAGFLKIHGECTKASRNPEAWSKWITMESKKRILWGVYTVDCYQSILCGSRPLLSPTDTRASYPCDEESWNALSASSWAQLPAQDPSSCFLSSLKGLLVGQYPTSQNLTSFGMRLLILCLHSLLLEAQTSILPTGMFALEQALQTWYNIWISSQWPAYSELSARCSFLTNNLALYHLAIHFLQNGRPRLDEKAFIGESTDANNPLIAKEGAYQDEMMRCVREIMLKL